MKTPNEAITKMESQPGMYGNGTGAKILALAKSGDTAAAAQLAASYGINGIALALLNGDSDALAEIHNNIIAAKKAKYRK